MLIGADVILDEIAGSRLVWISGFNRSHKTALGYRLAYEFMRSGKYRYFVSNIPDVWSTDLEKIKPEEGIYLDTVILLDEPGEFIKNEAERSVLESFMGKFRCLVIMPGRKKPFGACNLHIYPIFQGPIVGLPFVIYKWSYKYEKIKDAGWFIWWGMKEIYGIYDSDIPVTSDMGILDWLVDHRERVELNQPRKRYYGKIGSQYGILKLAQEEQEPERESGQTIQESGEGETILG